LSSAGLLRSRPAVPGGSSARTERQRADQPPVRPASPCRGPVATLWPPARSAGLGDFELAAPTRRPWRPAPGSARPESRRRSAPSSPSVSGYPGLGEHRPCVVLSPSSGLVPSLRRRLRPARLRSTATSGVIPAATQKRCRTTSFFEVWQRPHFASSAYRAKPPESWAKMPPRAIASALWRTQFQ